MQNIKILVNFTEQKVVHTELHAGSKEYQHLIKTGYVQVGVMKYTKNKDIPNPKFFWDSNYFEPEAKYLKDYYSTRQTKKSTNETDNPDSKGPENGE